jgi:hypothetical protein
LRGSGRHRQAQTSSASGTFVFDRHVRCHKSEIEVPGCGLGMVLRGVYIKRRTASTNACSMRCCRFRP